MVQALVNISEHGNRILNVIKARYGFKTKSQAIDFAAEWYAKNVLGEKVWKEIYKNK
jgi:hypothetical protein